VKNRLVLIISNPPLLLHPVSIYSPISDEENHQLYLWKKNLLFIGFELRALHLLGRPLPLEPGSQLWKKLLNPALFHLHLLLSLPLPTWITFPTFFLVSTGVWLRVLFLLGRPLTALATPKPSLPQHSNRSFFCLQS
jgi:hypothetical protein